MALSERPTAPNREHLGERTDDAILLLQQLRRLGDRDAGQRRRHIQRRAFIERRHELAADAQRQRQRRNQKDQVHQQRRFAEPQAQAKHREIDRLREARKGMTRFGDQSPADEKYHQSRDQRNRQQ